MKSLKLLNISISDETFRHILSLSKLYLFGCRKGEWNDAVLESLSQMRNLDKLELSCMKNLAEVIACLPLSLRFLKLQGSQVSWTQPAIKRLFQMENLEELEVTGTELTAEMIAHLPLTLRFLKLQDSQVSWTQPAIERLSRMENLEKLELNGTQLTCEVIEQLPLNLGSLELTNSFNIPHTCNTFQNLRDFSQTCWTQPAIKRLSQMENLEKLDLSRSTISKQTISCLPRSLRILKLTESNLIECDEEKINELKNNLESLVLHKTALYNQGFEDGVDSVDIIALSE